MIETAKPMIETAKRRGRQPVRQLSIFAENKVGRLLEIVRLLGKSDIHPVALTTLDTTDSSFIRMVVDDHEGARELLKKFSIFFHETRVLAVELPAASDLDRALACLVQAEINIHYAYAFLARPDWRPGLVLQVEDIDVAAQSLATGGFKVMDQSDISR
jgi:hypothetical protein